MNTALLLFFLFFPQDDSNLIPPEKVPAKALEAYNEGHKILEKARRGGANSIDLAEESLDHFRKAIRLTKIDFALPYYRIGIAYQYTKDYKDAKRALDKALKINPQFHEVLLELGDVWQWMKKYKEALREYDKALAIKPDYAVAHRNKALAYIRMQDWKMAKVSCKEALAIDSKEAFTKDLLKMVQKEIDGPGFERTYKKETSHFIIQTDVDQRFCNWIAEHAEHAYKKYASIFPKQTRKKNKYPVIVFSTYKKYIAYGSPENTGGYYSDFLKKLVLYKGRTDKDTLIVLYHEGFHQFLAYYLSDAPQWFNEGHGDYFGPSIYNTRKKKMEIKINPWRLPVVKQAIRKNNYTPFRKLMLMTQAELYDPKTVGLNYAQSWSMVYFFWHYEKGKYGKLLQKYFLSLRKGLGLRKAFDAAFGRVNLDSIEAEWRGYIRNLDK